MSPLRHIYRNPRTVFLIFLLLFTGYNLLWPDIMPYNGGFGFEGYNFYKPLAKTLNLKGINSYSAQRVAPYVALHGVFKGLGIAFTDANMLGFFKLLHLGIGIAVIFVWDALARTLRTGLAGAWIGYLCLLINFATLKHDFYIPFTYDRLALCSGLLSLYFHFSRRRIAFVLNALLALIIWPTALIYNSLLLFLPAGLALPETPNRTLGRIWGALIAAAFAALFINLIYRQHIPVPKHLAPAIKPLLPLAIAIAGGYLFYVQSGIASRLLPPVRELVPFLKNVFRPRWNWLGIAIITAAYLVLTRVLSDPTKSYLTPRQFSINFSYGALQRPGQFIVAHAIYYGLPALVIVLFWKTALRTLPKLGLGFGAVLLLALIQATNNETRQLANVLPAFAVLAALTARQLRIRPGAVGLAAAIALLVSKGWLRLNAFDPQFGKPGDVFPQTGFAKDHFLRWPCQIYHMNFGPWISTGALVLQAGVLLVFAILLRRSWKRPDISATPYRAMQSLVDQESAASEKQTAVAAPRAMQHERAGSRSPRQGQ